MGRAELNPPDSRKSHRAAAGAADRGLFSPCPREPPQLCPPQALGPAPQPLSTAQRGGEVAKQPAATASSPATFCPCAHGKLVPAATRRCSRCHSAAAETACTKPGNGNIGRDGAQLLLLVPGVGARGSRCKLQLGGNLVKY